MIRVSYLNTAKMTEADYQRMISELSEERAERAERYQKKEDRYLSAGAGHLLDVALKKMGREEKSLKYYYNDRGKPYVIGIGFNLSHSGTIAALALGNQEVGVDVQKIVPVKEELIERVCTEREYAYLSGFSGMAREREFFRLWTAKESASKYIGSGLPNPKEYEIDLVKGTFLYRGKTWKARFMEYPLEGYSLTACSAERFSHTLTKIEL